MTSRAAVACTLMLVVGVDAIGAQTVTPASDLEVLLHVHSVLHAADMITTSYDLTRSTRARELSPLLKPFADKPGTLAVVSTALSATEVWAIVKLRTKHPRLAVAMAAAIVATEVWAVTNNIRVAGRIQDSRSGWRPPPRP